MIYGQSRVTLVVLGSAAGLVFGWAMTRFLVSVFPSVADATAAVVYGRVLVVSAPLLFMVIALAACYLPARKSVHIDPLSALRQE